MTGPLGRRAAALLVDLDGTLTDPFVGITESFRYGMAEIGHPIPLDADLSWCIGPPLFTNFRTLLGPEADEGLVRAGVEAYRDRYGSVGKFENAVYPGIPEALEAFGAAGIPLHLATSKLLVHAREILDHFDLTRHFTSVHGSRPDGGLGDKAQLIGHILTAEGLDPSTLVMIGDRKHDILGARAHAIPTIGVLWGYGGAAELAEHGAAAVAARPADLLDIVLAG